MTQREPIRSHASGLRMALLSLALLFGEVAMAQPGAMPVVVTRAETRDIVEDIPLAGTVSAPRVAQLSPAVAGLVEAVMVEAGDRVDANASLLRLDVALARSALQAAEAATVQAREELADARRRLADAERLASRSSIAATQVRALQSEVSIDTATVKLREAEQRAEAERLERHRLRAPFAGVIGQKLTEAGEWVAPGDAVFELIADRGLRIDFRVPQAYFPRLARDAPVALRFDAHEGRAVAGRVGEIVPVSDPDARTFLVRVHPQANDLALTPGMSASGTLRLGTGNRGVVVPRDALLRHPDGRITVWIVDGDAATATATERVVTTGLAFDGQVVVTDGLAPGATIVVEGNEALRPGQRISIHSRR